MIGESCPDFGTALFCGMDDVAVHAVVVEFRNLSYSFINASLISDKKLLKSSSNVSMLRKAEQKETIYNGQTNT